MNKISIFLLVLALNFEAYSQCNLIRNGSFEERADGEHDSIPNALGQVGHSSNQYMKYWEDRLINKTCNGEKKIFHSPDWAKSSDTYNSSTGWWYNLKLMEGQIIQANSGEGYVGMSKCELIQQQLSSNNKIGNNNYYTISLNIRPSVQLNNNWLSPSPGILTVKLRKNKMQYTIGSNLCNNLCSSSYCDKLSENSGNTIQILNESITLSKYPFGDWYELKATFQAPPDGSDYDWVIIELSDQEPSCDKYILIDDVSITMDCNECSRTSGCINPTSNNYHYHTNGNWLRFDNLHNASKAEVFIYDHQFNLVTYFVGVENSINGITEPLYWNGKHNNNELSSGIYYWIIKAYNDCGSITTGYNKFVKENAVGDLTPPPPVYQYNNTIKIPKPCCQNDIYIDNITLSGPGTLEYHAVNNTYIGNNVNITNDAIVIFRAGNEIIGDPYQNSSPNADITAEIVPCSESGRLIADNNEDDIKNSFAPSINFVYDTTGSSTINSNVETSIDNGIKKIEKFNIYPNPNNGSFTIALPLKNLEMNIIVYDAMGKIAFQTITTGKANINIDLADFAPGLYFVKISDGKTIRIEKVVYSK